MTSCLGQAQLCGAYRSVKHDVALLQRPNSRRPAGRKWRARAQQASALQSKAKSVVDYYEILGVDDDVSQDDIKTAYRQLCKYCHPDVNDEGHDLCILLNEAYTTLSNPVARLKYNAHLQQALQDLEDDYTGQPLSKWLVGHRMGKNTDPQETRAVFVDEVACIGCKMCVWCASGTFRINQQHGRSRVYAQWVDREDKVEDAIASCPVDCIHWVQKDQLPALEYVMKNQVKVTDVGTMMGGAGGHVADVFAAADQFLKKRDKEEEPVTNAPVHASSVGVMLHQHSSSDRLLQKALISLKERSRQANYPSPAQEQARQRAADQLMKQQYSWLGPLSGVFAKNMRQGSASTYNSQGDIRRRSQVGHRRRSAKPQHAQSEGTIPVERSLVVVSKREG